jgi:hypothetical protein
MQSAAPIAPAEQRQRLAFERVALADDGHPLGTAVEVVVVVGIVSCVPSRRFLTTG